MERKHFLKSLIIGAIAAPALLETCKRENGTENGPNSGSGSSSTVSADNSCAVTPSETEGPYPTKNPSSFLRSDIRKGDGIGAAMTANISIVNVNNNCAGLENAVVDIWHCDAAGNYSEYNSYTSVDWLRGRQITDSKGLVTFKTIFPGWYQGRATHIHVHVYTVSGISLLITQIAFPDELCANVNNNGSVYGYTKGMNGYTYNNADNILNDSLAKEIATVTGSLSEGFVMNSVIRVKA